MARLVALTLCFLVFTALVFAACPNGCSGHGNCSGSTCSCSTGYTGQDCSIADVLLQSGKMVNGSLHTFEWKYYHINVPASTNGLRVNVEQTSKYGDIDVFVNPGTYPTTQDYYDKDTSTSKHIEITVDNPVTGLWYVGLYGYWQAEYNITATVITSCVTPCVHGTCQANECVCTTPYVVTSDHPDCTVYDMALTNGVSAAGSVQTRETKFYHINVPANQQLTITLTQSSSSADVDLYLKLGDYPTFYDFDYLNATIDTTTILDIANPDAGLYYIGVYGYNGDSYTILASWSQVQGCDNQCSGATHGTCGAGTCVCTADYSGKTCDTKKTPLTVNTPVSGYCDSNTWNYYQVSTSTQNNVLFQVKQLGDGDCDLYVRQDSQPTRIDYDFADLSYAEDFNLTLPSPGFSNWYLGIYGWQACSYELTYLVDSTCACAPGGHGRCSAGSSVCVCNSGWAGYDCSSQSYTLADGEVVVHQKVQQNQWKYFEITSMSHVLIVTLEETATSGFLSLYVSMTGYPSLENYDFSDVENTNQHEVHIVFDTAITRRYFIGVLGNAFANVPEGTGIDFSITAWYPPF